MCESKHAGQPELASQINCLVEVILYETLGETLKAYIRQGIQQVNDGDLSVNNFKIRYRNEIRRLEMELYGWDTLVIQRSIILDRVTTFIWNRMCTPNVLEGTLLEGLNLNGDPRSFPLEPGTVTATQQAYATEVIPMQVEVTFGTTDNNVKTETQQPKGNNIMNKINLNSTITPITAPTLVYGRNAETYSDDQITDDIASIEDDMKTLKGLSNQTKAVKAQLKAMKKNIKALVKFSDARYDEENGTDDD